MRRKGLSRNREDGLLWWKGRIFSIYPHRAVPHASVKGRRYCSFTIMQCMECRYQMLFACQENHHELPVLRDRTKPGHSVASRSRYRSLDRYFIHLSNLCMLSKGRHPCVIKEEGGQIRDSATDRQQTPSPLCSWFCLALERGFLPRSRHARTTTRSPASTIQKQATTLWHICCTHPMD